MPDEPIPIRSEMPWRRGSILLLLYLGFAAITSASGQETLTPEPSIGPNALYAACAVCVVVLLITMVVVLWNRSLQKEVLARTAELSEELTERKRAQEAVAEAERRYRGLVETMKEGLAVKDPEGKLTYVNGRLCEMLGYSRDELLGRPLADLFDDDNRRILEEHIDKGREGAVTSYELTWNGKDGGKIQTIVAPASLVDAEGRAQGSFAVITDIEDRRTAEEALRLSENRFRNVVESSPLGIYLYELEENNRLVLAGCNPAANRMTGFDATQSIGKTIEEVFPGLTETEIPDCYRQSAAEGKAWHWDEVPYKEGSIDGVFEVHAFQSSPGRMVVVFNDITDRKRTEEERRKLETQVQQAQKLESLGVLAGGIAHDFNNLLLAILGNADLALLDMAPESPARERVEDILKASQRAAELAKQMLAYSGKGKFIVQALNLATLVDEMAHMLEVSISKKVILRRDFAENLPSIEADATQIRQVVMNLITNASDAIGDRSGVISIATGAMHADRAYLDETYLNEPLGEGTYVTLEVADTGCGMDAETRDKIFDPFFTTKFTGRGLGMAAVLGIIRGHNGAIRIYSEVGKGTTIKVLFPAVEAKASASGARGATGWEGSGTAMLVDDEETVRTVGRKMLERLGMAVVTAEDGRQALDLYRERDGEIDCVILDLTMPHMDGEETFRELRRLKKDLPIIMSSGYDSQEVSRRFLGKGLAGFIQKPYQMDAMAQALQDALGEKGTDSEQ